MKEMRIADWGTGRC